MGIGTAEAEVQAVSHLAAQGDGCALIHAEAALSKTLIAPSCGSGRASGLMHGGKGHVRVELNCQAERDTFHVWAKKALLLFVPSTI